VGRKGKGTFAERSNAMKFCRAILRLGGGITKDSYIRLHFGKKNTHIIMLEHTYMLDLHGIWMSSMKIYGYFVKLA